MYLNLEGVIPAGAGIWATLIAFETIPMPAGLRDKPWRESWIRFAKVAGPLLILFGIATLFMAF